VPDSSYLRRGKRRFDDDEPAFVKRDRHRRSLPDVDAFDAVAGLPAGETLVHLGSAGRQPARPATLP
jgi:RIO kinase 1